MLIDIGEGYHFLNIISNEDYIIFGLIILID